MFRNYFKIALRNLNRNKIYSFINIAGLSIGLACAMLVMLYVKDEVSDNRFHKNVSNIYRVVGEGYNKKNHIKGEKSPVTGFFQGPRLKKMFPVFNISFV